MQREQDDPQDPPPSSNSAGAPAALGAARANAVPVTAHRDPKRAEKSITTDARRKATQLFQATRQAVQQEEQRRPSLPTAPLVIQPSGRPAPRSTPAPSQQQPEPEAPVPTVEQLMAAPRFGVNARELILRAAASAFAPPPGQQPAARPGQGSVPAPSSTHHPPAPPAREPLVVLRFQPTKLLDALPPAQRPQVQYVPRSTIPRLTRQGCSDALLGGYLALLAGLLKLAPPGDDAAAVRAIKADGALVALACATASAHEAWVYRQVASKAAYSQQAAKALATRASLLEHAPATQLDVLLRAHGLPGADHLRRQQEPRGGAAGSLRYAGQPPAAVAAAEEEDDDLFGERDADGEGDEDDAERRVEELFADDGSGSDGDGGGRAEAPGTARVGSRVGGAEAAEAAEPSSRAVVEDRAASGGVEEQREGAGVAATGSAGDAGGGVAEARVAARGAPVGATDQQAVREGPAEAERSAADSGGGGSASSPSAAAAAALERKRRQALDAVSTRQRQRQRADAPATAGDAAGGRGDGDAGASGGGSGVRPPLPESPPPLDAGPAPQADAATGGGLGGQGGHEEEALGTSGVTEQVAEYVRGVLDPLYRAQVVSKEVYKDVVRRVVRKVMEHHRGAATASFLLAEHEAIRRFTLKTLQQAQSPVPPASTLPPG